MISELESQRHRTVTRDSNLDTAVEFDYPVENGKNRSEWLRIGTIMQATGYPEYQPYWVYLSPPVDDGFGESISRYRTHEGREWLPMRRPPNDLWNQLVAKDMRSYLEHQMLRVWSLI